MRRLVVAVLVATLALTLVACGGGGNDTAASTGSEGSAPAAPPPSSKVSGGEDVIADRSPTETVVYAPLSENVSDLPTAVAQNIQAKEPTLLFFYDPSQATSRQTRTEVDTALKANRGLMSLVAYDVSRYVKVDPQTGQVTVDGAINNEPEAAKVATLIADQDVSQTPFIIITDDSGYTTWRGRAFQDHRVIEAEIVRATK